MSIRKDCLHYHEEPYMGARVDCCLAETAFGMCPCTPDCENYIPKDSSVRIVRCKDCIYSTKSRAYKEICMCNNERAINDYVKSDDFCSYGKRREE